MNILSEIEEAQKRLSGNILQTPLLPSPWLSSICNGEVYLKMESEQYTGSFKARGSLNKLMWLKEQAGTIFPVTASTGNHGLGFARALDLLDMKGKIFLPKNAVSSKIEAIRAYDVELEFHGDDPFETEQYARKTAEDNGWIYISPYNDLQVVAGQGTIGAEILDQLPQVNNIVATIGGGGLISGIASHVKSRNPKVHITGCQPENSPEMTVSVKTGTYREVETKPTLSDGSAGGFEKDSITFDMCKELVDDFILISEEEIRKAIRLMVEHHHKIIEGSAAVAVATILKEPERFSGQNTAVVICGANISFQHLASVLCK